MNEPGKLVRLWHFIRSGEFDRIGYPFWIKLRGLDFGEQSCEQLGLSAERSKRHTASGGPLLERVLKALDIPPGSRVVDLGSGKGGAAITLAKYFHEVVGVELSHKMVDVANANVRKVKRSNIQFLCADAGDFNDYESFDYVYMYNPFPQVVMAQVAAHLKNTRLEHSKPAKIIYKNPLQESELLACGWRAEREFTFVDSLPVKIYSFVGIPDSLLQPRPQITS